MTTILVSPHNYSFVCILNNSSDYVDVIAIPQSDTGVCGTLAKLNVRWIDKIMYSQVSVKTNDVQNSGFRLLA